MKITKHKHGTFTISGLTRGDMEMLTFGASCAEAFHAKECEKGVIGSGNGHEGKTPWNVKNATAFSNLYWNLKIAVASSLSSVGSKYLPFGKSMELNGFEGDAPYKRTGTDHTKEAV